MKNMILIPVLLTAVFACEEIELEPIQDSSHVEDVFTPDQSDSESASQLNFIPDPGIRVNNASNSWAKGAPQDDGTTVYYLFYQDHEGSGGGPAPQMAVTSTDGLNFDASQARPYSPAGNSSDPDLIENDVGNWWRQLYKLGKSFPGLKGPLQVVEYVKVKIDEFKQHIPLIQAMLNPGMRDRHWEKLKADIGRSVQPTEMSTLASMLEQVRNRPPYGHQPPPTHGAHHAPCTPPPSSYLHLRVLRVHLRTPSPHTTQRAVR